MYSIIASRTPPHSATGQWSASDLTLLDAGLGGERLVARIRLALCALLLLVPLHSTVLDPTAEHFVGLSVATGALVLAAAVYALVGRGLFSEWLGFGTSLLDVSAVSLALASYLVLDLPHTAVNGRIVFECYFLAIAATCLRYDRRVCWAAGALAVAQYLAIVLVATSRWELNDPKYAPYDYGYFDWSTQLSRLILLSIATLLSATIVQRATRLRQLSTVDRLTGLLNRGYFDERAEDELSRASRYRRPLSVALLDADHFKAFNDSFGHAAGDGALRSLASVLRAAVRRSDVIARYGGEEFVILFPETGPAEAVEKMNAIREQVMRMSVPLPRSTRPVQITVSVGVASWPADGAALDEILHCADGRLFTAKRAGRNRVVGADTRISGEIAPPFRYEDRAGRRVSGGD